MIQFIISVSKNFVLKGFNFQNYINPGPYLTATIADANVKKTFEEVMVLLTETDHPDMACATAPSVFLFFCFFSNVIHGTEFLGNPSKTWHRD